MFKMNKKAQLFMLMLTIFTLAIVTYALFRFSISKSVSKEMITPASTLTQLYHDSDEFIIFAKESARISLAQAYYDAAKQNSYIGRECQYDRFNKGFIELCSFSNDIDEKIISAADNNFKELIKKHRDERFRDAEYRIEKSGDAFNFKSEKRDIDSTSKDYSAKYSLDPSFSITLRDLGLTDFRIIYDAMQQCKGLCGKALCDKDGFRKIESCAKEAIKGFDMELTDNNDKVFFELKSKKSFLINEAGISYKQIALSFGVTK